MENIESAAPRVGLMDLKDGYLVDTAYTWGFYEGQSPFLINYVARLNGVDARPIEEPFTYLELGCGNALTVNVLAACFPHGDFYAVDLNADHIANGRMLAEKGGLNNVSFFLDTFERLREMQLPAFDYITLHGVYSWVSAEVRRDIVKVIDAKLKPGGLVYVSYNTMQGWAALLPLRQIMLSYSEHRDLQGSRERAAEGLRYLRYLRDNKATYFEKNPGSGAALDRLLQQDLSYVVHEYFNESWEPQYFSQIAAEMAQAGLRFCGTTAMARNYADLSIPKAFRGLLDAANDDFVRETHKSLILNEKFRTDVYVRGTDFVPQEQRSRLFETTFFGANVPATEITRHVQVGAMTVNYEGKIYDELIPALADGTRSAAEICGLPAFESVPPADVIKAINNLVPGGQFRPLAARAPQLSNRGPENLRIASRFNRAVLEERLLAGGANVVPLASPVMGNGIMADSITGLLLLAFDRGGSDDLVERVLVLLEETGRSLRTDDRTVSDPAEARKLIDFASAKFRTQHLPLLIRFGILEPVAA